MTQSSNPGRPSSPQEPVLTQRRSQIEDIDLPACIVCYTLVSSVQFVECHQCGCFICDSCQTKKLQFDRQQDRCPHCRANWAGGQHRPPSLVIVRSVLLFIDFPNVNF